MNNFEINEKAKQLEDELTPYALAERVIELEKANEDLRSELLGADVINAYLERALEELLETSCEHY